MIGNRKERILKVIKMSVVFFAGFLFAFVLFVLIPFLNFPKAIMEERNQMQTRLLCETDHQALLEACRELSRRVKAGDLESGKYYIRMHPDRKASQFPKAILDLAPNYVYIDENDSRRVMLEMEGGLDHFGVLAYAEGYTKPDSQYKYGDKELIPGLWYYDDGYIDNPPGYDNSQYDKTIEELMEKGKGKVRKTLEK